MSSHLSPSRSVPTLSCQHLITLCELFKDARYKKQLQATKTDTGCHHRTLFEPSFVTHLFALRGNSDIISFTICNLVILDEPQSHSFLFFPCLFNENQLREQTDSSQIPSDRFCVVAAVQWQKNSYYLHTAPVLNTEHALFMTKSVDCDAGFFRRNRWVTLQTSSR